MRKKVPDYLLRMIDHYLSDRWVIYEGQIVSQRTDDIWRRSRVACPLVWNVMYDDFLQIDLPAGTSAIGFADDALVVCAADNIRIRELRINESMWRAKRWLDGRGLKMAPEKTEAFLVTDRRSFQYSRIVLGKHEVEWKTSIKYLGVQLDRRPSFAEHLKIANAKAIQFRRNLARLMSNIGGPREAKRKLGESCTTPLKDFDSFSPHQKKSMLPAETEQNLTSLIKTKIKVEARKCITGRQYNNVEDISNLKRVYSLNKSVY